MAWSHSLVHLIGGEDDTNRNTTQRILMLLESAPIRRREAYDRVCKTILDRYILEDPRFIEGNAKYRVPRFLLNDFARYGAPGPSILLINAAFVLKMGAAMRNIKLRMSRKLIYVSGLLVCFACHLELSGEERRKLFDGPDSERRAIDFFRKALQRTPLEILCGPFLRHPHLHKTARRVSIHTMDFSASSPRKIAGSIWSNSHLTTRNAIGSIKICAT